MDKKEFEFKNEHVHKYGLKSIKWDRRIDKYLYTKKEIILY
ncbi:MAG: hypothetical protein ABIJ14_01010 [Nanoarchaeota archaeon]